MFQLLDRLDAGHRLDAPPFPRNPFVIIFLYCWRQASSVIEATGLSFHAASVVVTCRSIAFLLLAFSFPGRSR